MNFFGEQKMEKEFLMSVKVFTVKEIEVFSSGNERALVANCEQRMNDLWFQEITKIQTEAFSRQSLRMGFARTAQSNASRR
jgi:hypothetical protein